MEPTGFAGFFATYGTWVWCGILFTVFIVPAIVISLVVYFVSKKSIDKEVLKEKKSKGLNPKIKTTAIILSIFFSFWSWLYTYKVNLKKFWITLSITLTYIIIIIGITIGFDAETIFINYGTWIWLFWLLLSGSIWLWALLDNSIKPTSFYMNYPKGYELKDEKPTIQKDDTTHNSVNGKSIFCMNCGEKLPSTAVYCKKCGKEVG